MSRILQSNKTGVSLTVFAVVILVILIAVAGAYFISSNGSPSGTPTPSPSATPYYGSPSQSDSTTSSPSGTPYSGSPSPTPYYGSPLPTGTTTGSPSQSSATTASPSATPYYGSASPSSASSGSPSPSGATTVAGAKSLQFSVSLTQGGATNGSYTYYTKNVDEISNSYKWGRPANFLMRIEYTNAAGDKSITVMDAAQQKAWVFSNGKWQDISSVFAGQFDPLNTQFLGFWNSLKSWSGNGDWTYNANGATVRIYDILVNPTFSGKLFGPN
jgi:hypothetical protein